MAIRTKPRKERLPPEVFDLPVDKMREGYYTDAYFNHTRETLLARLGRADGARAPRRGPDRRVGAGPDDRWRLHALRASRDRLPGNARAPDAHRDECRARPRGCERQADQLHAGPS